MHLTIQSALKNTIESNIKMQFKYSSCALLLLLIYEVQLALCENDNKTISQLKHINLQENCYFYRQLRSLIKNFLLSLNHKEQPLSILPGIEIVRDIKVLNQHKSFNTNIDPEHIIDYFIQYIRTHALHINLYEFVAQPFFQQRNYLVEARKKDKGQGLLMAMSVMFAKMMALLGIGGIGLLALKALGVASTALVLAGLIGVKTLAQNGNESTHSIQYVTADGHVHASRRKRNIPKTHKSFISASNGWHLK